MYLKCETSVATLEQVQLKKKKKNRLVALHRLKLPWQLSDTEYHPAPNFPPAHGPGGE